MPAPLFFVCVLVLLFIDGFVVQLYGNDGGLPYDLRNHSALLFYLFITMFIRPVFALYGTAVRARTCLPPYPDIDVRLAYGGEQAQLWCTSRYGTAPTLCWQNAG